MGERDKPKKKIIIVVWNYLIITINKLKNLKLGKWLEPTQNHFPNETSHTEISNKNILSLNFQPSFYTVAVGNQWDSLEIKKID